MERVNVFAPWCVGDERGGNNRIVNNAVHLNIHLPVVYLFLSLACSSSTSDPSFLYTNPCA